MNEEYKKAIYKVKLDLYSKMKIYGKGKKILSIYDNLEKCDKIKISENPRIV